MDSDETKIESVVIAILASQATLPAAVHYDASADTVAAATRLTVQAMPKLALVNARSTTRNARVWQAPLTIRMQAPLGKTPAELSDYCAKIDAAMEGTAPAGAVTLATSLGFTGFKIETQSGGDRQGEMGSNRFETRSYNVIFMH